jgi:hypothetical protein
MKKRLAQLACRRLELMEDIEAQRMDMAAITRHLHKPLAVADAGFRTVRFIFHHPALITGGVTALLAWRRHGFVGLMQHGWRLLILYPSTIFLGVKYLSSTACPPGEERNSEILQNTSSGAASQEAHHQ